MQSTPVRVSVVVFGTLTAVGAYGLGRTSASTPDTQPAPNPENKKPTRSPVLPVKLAPSISSPEQLGLQSSISPSNAATSLSQATVKPSTKPSAATAEPTLQFASLRKLAPKQLSPQASIRRISVDQVPIDAVIASALPSRAASIAKAQKTQSSRPVPAPPTQTTLTPQFQPLHSPLEPSSPLPPSTVPQSNFSDPQSNSLEVPATTIDDASYTLGPGDRIRVEIFNVPEYSREYQVLVNGIVNLYLVGPLSVRGMSPLEAQTAIAAKYSPILQKARVDVTLLAPRPLKVAIAGEIGHPGTYALTTQENSSFPTLTQLIQQAGGITQAANPRKVQVRRPQQSKPPLIINADLWELAQTGDMRQDLTLRDGDTVVIPTNSSVNLAESSQLAAANFATDTKKALNITVVGEVMRPGPLVLASSTGGLPTLTQALQQAGGISASANMREVEVRRSTRSGTTQTTRLNLWQLLASGDATQDMVLQQGDTIVVPKGTALTAAEITQVGSSTFAPSTIRVNIVGEVESPGAVQVPANTPLNQALLSAGGFNRRANRRSVQLLRLNPDGTVSRQPVSIDLARGVDEKGNPILRNNDVILVDRSGSAKVEDTLDRVGGFLGKLFPLGFFLH